MKNQSLFFRKLGSGKPVVILHGLFGSSDNWLTIGKELSSDCEVYLADLRNHGQSFHSPEHNYKAMADDLKRLLEEQGLMSGDSKPVIVGHSMGGKTAMTFALGNPTSVSKLVVVDIAPRAYPVHHEAILNGLKAIDLGKIGSRKEADEVLAAHVPEADVRQFLLKNLARTSDGFEWKLNLLALDENMNNIVAEVQGEPISIPSLFIRGENSGYIEEQDKSAINKLFPGTNVVTIPGAGHWVHAEQPEAFLGTLKAFLS